MSLMKYTINRRKFLGLFGCTCCSLILPSCATVPITERRQLSIIPETTINRQAAAAYAQFKNKAKLITKGSQLKEVIDIGKKIENSVTAFFKSLVTDIKILLENSGSSIWILFDFE